MPGEENKDHPIPEKERPEDKKTIKHKLSDRLAFNRTKLANERTLLAYIRTAIGSCGAGIALLKLLEYPDAKYIGVTLIAAAPVILIVGVLRFIRMNKKVEDYKKEADDEN